MSDQPTAGLPAHDPCRSALQTIRDEMDGWRPTTVHSVTGGDVPMVMLNPAKLQSWVDRLTALLAQLDGTPAVGATAHEAKGDLDLPSAAPVDKQP